MLFEDLPPGDLKSIGKSILQMRSDQQNLRNTLFVINEDNESIEEKFTGASEIYDIFDMWIKGESIDYISEQVFQDTPEILIQIFKLLKLDPYNFRYTGLLRA